MITGLIEEFLRDFIKRFKNLEYLLFVVSIYNKSNQEFYLHYFDEEDKYHYNFLWVLVNKEVDYNELEKLLRENDVLPEDILEEVLKNPVYLIGKVKMMNKEYFVYSIPIERYEIRERIIKNCNHYLNQLRDRNFLEHYQKLLNPLRLIVDEESRKNNKYPVEGLLLYENNLVVMELEFRYNRPRKISKYKPKMEYRSEDEKMKKRIYLPRKPIKLRKNPQLIKVEDKNMHKEEENIPPLRIIDVRIEDLPVDSQENKNNEKEDNQQIEIISMEIEEEPLV